MKVLALLFLLFLSLKTVYSQDLLFKQYNASQGLPSNFLYEVIQDSKGYLWIATENGVSRFDGRNFKNYTIEDGLADNEIFKIREDSVGRIWFLSYNGRLSFYFNGIFYHSRNTDFIKDLNFSYFVKAFFADSEGRLWFSSRDEGIKVLYPDGSINHFNDSSGIFNRIYAITHNSDSVIAFGPNSRLTFTHSGLKSDPPQKVFFSNSKGQGRYFNQREVLNQIKISPEDEVVCVLADSKGNFWIGTKSGLFNTATPEKRLLSGYFITSLLEDKEGNVWISTLGRGLFMLPALAFYSVNGNEQQLPALYSLFQHGDYLYAGTDNGSILEISLKNFETREIVISSGKEFNKVKEIYILKDNMWCGSDKGIYYKNTDGKFTKIGGNLSVKDLAVKDHTLYFATSKGVVAVNGINKTYKFITRKRATSVAIDSNGLWIGTLNGIEKAFPGKIFGETLHSFAEKRISSLYALPEKLLIGTYGQGLYTLTSTSFPKLSEKEGLKGGIINDIRKGENDDFWVLSNNAINRLKYKKGGFSEIVSYSTEDGLLSDQLNAFLLVKDTVYIATDKGLTFFVPEKAGGFELNPGIFITAVEINNDPYDLEKQPVLKYDQNNLKLDFTGIALSSLGDVKFQYILEGLENEWSETENNFAIYRGLKAGNYKFRVRTITKHGMLSNQEASLGFRIEPHFSDTLWFKNALLIGSVFSTFLIAFLYVKSYKRRYKRKLQMLQLEHSALRSQMNPHFLFNTLNSIQQFVLSEDKRTANKYLVKFAGLIRKYLETSKQLYVMVKDEVEVLETYVELENLRVNNKMNITFTKPGGISNGKYIPGKLIQPIVENALHALIPSVEEGSEAKLEITFTESENSMEVIVKDNGPGFDLEEVRRKEKDGKMSTALDNISERLEILKKVEGYTTDFSIRRLSEPGSGTEIKLILPLIT